MENKYTGREIAVLTDIHALLEPTIAVLNDIKKRNIKEVLKNILSLELTGKLRKQRLMQMSRENLSRVSRDGNINLILLQAAVAIIRLSL